MNAQVKLKELVSDDVFKVEMVYATDQTFFPTPVYKDYGLEKCYAHPELHEKLMKLKPILREKKLKLQIYDVYRPVAIQRLMWDILPDERYVAHPDKGSNHNRAAAIDCYLTDQTGKSIGFPCEPDGYTVGIEKDMPKWIAELKKGQYDYVCKPEEKHLCQNRDMFRQIMESVGLVALNEEWWHYELPNAKTYPLIEDYR